MRRTLAARLDNAGDVLLTGPAIRALARRGPVTMLCGPAGVEAARLLPGVSDVIEFAAPWVGDNAPAVNDAAIGRLIERLRSCAFDEAFIFTSSHQSPLPLALVLRMAQIPWIAANSVDHPGSLLDLRRRPDRRMHEVEENLALVEARVGTLTTSRALEVRSTGGNRSGAPGHAVSSTYVVVHPGASVPARAVPHELAREAIDELARRGHTVAVTGGVHERRYPAIDTGAGRVIDLVGTLSFPALARVLADASVVVCGNTGPAHLAAAVGTSVVSLFAPVVPLHQWRPWGVSHIVLGDQSVPCAGCRSRACPLDQQLCVSSVTAQDIGDAVDNLVARAGAHA